MVTGVLNSCAIAAFQIDALLTEISSFSAIRLKSLIIFVISATEEGLSNCALTERLPKLISLAAMAKEFSGAIKRCANFNPK